MYHKLSTTIHELLKKEVPKHRKELLAPLVTYLQAKLESNEKPYLNFICTHNSRRSQLAQVWASTAAAYFNIMVECNSGGVEVTAFNSRAIDSLLRAGFRVDSSDSENPTYNIFYSPDSNPIIAYSKTYDQAFQQHISYAAIMTCSHADENCPYIPSAEVRIPLLYDDPKEYDGTKHESKMYDERSEQIAIELLYVFKSITPISIDEEA